MFLTVVSEPRGLKFVETTSMTPRRDSNQELKERAGEGTAAGASPDADIPSDRDTPTQVQPGKLEGVVQLTTGSGQTGREVAGILSTAPGLSGNAWCPMLGDFQGPLACEETLEKRLVRGPMYTSGSKQHSPG